MTISIKEQLEKQGFIIKEVKGISMYPLFVEGENLVQIEKVNNDIKVNDIALFIRDNDENKYVLHRVIDIKRNYYLVCGDNQNEAEVVFSKQILGKVTGYYKNKQFISLEDKEYKEYLNNLEKDITKRKTVKPLNKDELAFLALVKCSMFNLNTNQDNFNYEQIYAIAKRQYLTAFIFKAINQTLCPKDTYEKFKIDYYENISRNVLFESEKQKVSTQLQQNKIDFLFFKGSDINNLYPTSESRFSSDVDVLVKEDKKLKDVIESMGYTIDEDLGFVYECSKDKLYSFEFHNRLFGFNDKVGKYFNDTFNRSIKISDYQYKMNNEDFVAYIIAHFNNHYPNGVGLRFYMDFYFVINKIEYDKNKLEQILKQLDLYDFYLFLLKTTKQLFDTNKDLLFDENNIFSNDLFGYLDTRIKEEIKQYGKFKYILKKAFPPKEIACQYLPATYNHPILLPVAWIYRIIIKLTKKSELNKIRMQISNLLKH